MDNFSRPDSGSIRDPLYNLSDQNSRTEDSDNDKIGNPE